MSSPFGCWWELTDIERCCNGSASLGRIRPKGTSARTEAVLCTPPHTPGVDDGFYRMPRAFGTNTHQLQGCRNATQFVRQTDTVRHSPPTMSRGGSLSWPKQLRHSPTLKTRGGYPKGQRELHRPVQKRSAPPFSEEEPRKLESP